MKINKKELKAKGWTEKEISSTEKIIGKEDTSAVKTQIMLYWMIIFAMVFITLLVSFWLIPFFVVFQGWIVFLVLFILGLSFGAMFNNLIIHLEHLNRKHYILAGMLIPIVAIASLFIITKAAAYAAAKINLPARQSPLEVSAVYLIGFLLPYIYGLLYQRKK